MAIYFVLGIQKSVVLFRKRITIHVEALTHALYIPLTPTKPKNSPRPMAREILFTALLEGAMEQPVRCGMYTCSHTVTPCICTMSVSGADYSEKRSVST